MTAVKSDEPETSVLQSYIRITGLLLTLQEDMNLQYILYTYSNPMLYISRESKWLFIGY
jgi:hypothetical protein